MMVENIDTLVIGAGQAGLAMSEHLRRRDVPHLVVERRRIAERWRSERWDSLVANGPAWHDCFPGVQFPGAVDPDGFATRDQLVAYFEAFASSSGTPIRCGVSVEALHQNPDGSGGFRAETSPQGVIYARHVVVATGAFQRPKIPLALVPGSNGSGGAIGEIVQMHSSSYRNPSQLPPGAVLVVGAGSSGVQIADELLRSGRQVYLSVGRHNRPPRRYRGRDYCWWLGKLGKWDARTPAHHTRHVTIAVSGVRGGATVDFRDLAGRGMRLLGRMEGCRDGCVMSFRPDLRRNIVEGDRDYLSILREADELIERERLELPEEPEAHKIMADPPCLTDPQLELDLVDAGVSAIIWATGYSTDFEWVDIAGAFDSSSAPYHKDGVSTVPGLYFLGLPWLSRRASSFIFGVWNDAEYLAKDIDAARR